MTTPAATRPRGVIARVTPEHKVRLGQPVTVRLTATCTTGVPIT